MHLTIRGYGFQTFNNFIFNLLIQNISYISNLKGYFKYFPKISYLYFFVKVINT